jgi:HK97 family phage major capsid protein
MFSDSTLLSLQGLQDKYGRPLWQPGLSTDAPNQLLGKPYHINNFMPSIGGTVSPPVGNKSILFGDMSRFKVRKVKAMTVQRLIERYAELGQIGIIAFARYDSDIIDAGMHPIQYLAN